MDDGRVNAFRTAKKATAKNIITALESLLQVLKTVTKQDYTLDSKLADYVFFPLSHVLRESNTVPVRVQELALQCLQILITRGWRNSIASDLAKQLLILLTFFAGGSATEPKSKDVNEDLGTIAYACLTSLLQVSDAAGLSVEGSVESSNFPVLGHSVSVLLDGVLNGPSAKTRLAALNALDAMVSNISDHEALRNFLPGIVSSLTKLLSSGNRTKGPFRIVQGSVQVLRKIVLKVVNDDNLTEGEPSQRGIVESGQSLVLKTENTNKDPWLEATSSQLKLALANILPLRYHDRDDVRMALFQLCTSILQRCSRSLNQSASMMVESSVIICTQSSEVDAIELTDNLTTVMAGNPELIDVLKSSVRDWLIALPRIMQSNDDVPKKRTVDQISMAFRIIDTQGTPFVILDKVVMANLRASVSAAIRESATKTIQDVSDRGLEVSQLLKSGPAFDKTMPFPEVMFSKTSQKATITSLRRLIFHISKSPSSSTLRREIVESLRTASGDDQLASLWLSLHFFGSLALPSNDFDQLIHTQSDSLDSQNPLLLLDEVYDFSLSVLSKSTYDIEVDWRLQALSLQAVTLQARQQRSDFRPELVDALYPILERLGSPNAALVHQAIAALNLVSKACDYHTPQELIIENVDYLVNAVALKLNTFDISPQAPQVLVMMLQLCGARLIPYLDDLVESIFTILEYYHGYPTLVESMFSVLSSIVEEQNKASATAILDKPEPVPRIKTYKPISFADLAAELREGRIEKPHLDPLPSPPSSPDPEAEVYTEADPPENTSAEDKAPPLSKSLQIITSIATLTQHHLPTSSPSLRLLLLRLLPSAFHPLSHHQDTLLPLVNSLWPVLIARLYDPEPYICIATCEALGSLCRTAGEFMSSRFENEWSKIMALARKVEGQMLVERKAMGRGGMRQRVWEGVMALVASVVEWVGVSGETEDDVWELVGEGVERGDGEGLRALRGVLEVLNPDALWLIEERARLKMGGEFMEKPVFEGVEFPGFKI
ncbi:MAG: hypothetical protein Q9195_001285 [Heterodermia aff. obscurata]